VWFRKCFQVMADTNKATLASVQLLSERYWVYFEKSKEPTQRKFGPESLRETIWWDVLSGYAAFTRFKLVRATQVPGMRAQVCHVSYEKFDRFNFEASCDFHYSTYNKNLRAHHQHLTLASQLASCKRRLPQEKKFSLRTTTRLRMNKPCRNNP
jgi:hypothetical protein